MTRRSRPQSKIDKTAWPVTVRVKNPSGGYMSMGRCNDPLDWLRINLGLTEFAHTGLLSPLTGEATEFHFRGMEDAAAFLARFPELELADGTLSPQYSSPHIPFGRQEEVVCALYHQDTSQELMRRLFRDRLDDRLGNLAPGDVCPNRQAPLIRHAGQGLELVVARWGLPTPTLHVEMRGYDSGVPNVRNTLSEHWRRWLDPEHRCLVPLTRFAEARGTGDGTAWFELADPDAIGFFAGLHVPRWRAVRKLRDRETVDDLFGVLTCRPNGVVAPIHPRAMPVILTEPAEWDIWLDAPWSEAKELQRPLNDAALALVE